MSIPNHVREELKQRLWNLADDIDWMNLSPTTKSRYYEYWTQDPNIGGVLARYIDRGRVRVYLKDTLLKAYTRSKLGDESRPFRVLGLPATADSLETYEKPHGRRLQDGRVICWGRADSWKLVLMGLFERSYASETYQPYAAVLTQATGRFHEHRVRVMVEKAAEKLGVERLVWLES